MVERKNVKIKDKRRQKDWVI